MDEVQKVRDDLESLQHTMLNYTAAYEQIRLMLERASQCVKSGSLSPEDAYAVGKFAMTLQSGIATGLPPKDMAMDASKECERLKEMQKRFAHATE